MKNEPILVNAVAVTGAVSAIIALLVATGIPIDDTLNAAIMGVVSAVVIPLATWWFARRHTVTVEKANQALREQALHLPDMPTRQFKTSS